MLLRYSLSRTVYCPRRPQATLSALVVLGLIPLQLAPVIAWMMLGQVVPKPKDDERLFPATWAFDRAGSATTGEPQPLNIRSRWSLTEGVLRERSLYGLNLPKWRGEAV